MLEQKKESKAFIQFSDYFSSRLAMQALLVIILSIPIAFIYGQKIEANSIVGLWKSPEGNLMIKIDKIGSLYQGRIAWLEGAEENTEPLLDKNNPQPHLRNIPLKGNKMIRELSFDSEEQLWSHGKYYDPFEGKFYDCTVRLLNEQTIQIIREPDQQKSKREIWHRQ